MPREPNTLPPVPTGTQAAMALDNQSPLFRFVRTYEPNNADLQQQFREDLTEVLHAYVAESDTLARLEYAEYGND